jgi:hypothetical protein
MTKSFAEILKEQRPEQTEANVGTFRAIMNEQKKERIREEGAKEECQKNIILYKIAEEEGDSREDRITKDKKVIDDIFEHLGVTTEIKAFFRLGKKNTMQDRKEQLKSSFNPKHLETTSCKTFSN